MSLSGFISYKRVGWTGQTPWNPTNLNIMDKGIKDNNDMIANLRDEVSALNNNKVDCNIIDYNNSIPNEEDLIKAIHSKYDLNSKPAVIYIMNNGIRACIGYNYGANSAYGAYIYFDIFGGLRYARCTNSTWYFKDISNPIKYIDVVYPSITIYENQWFQITNDSANKEIYNNNLAGKTVYNAQLVNWSGDSSTPYGVDSNGIYIIGNTGGVFKNVVIRYFYY